MMRFILLFDGEHLMTTDIMDQFLACKNSVISVLDLLQISHVEKLTVEPVDNLIYETTTNILIENP